MCFLWGSYLDTWWWPDAVGWLLGSVLCVPVRASDHSPSQHYTLTTQYITSSTHEHPRATDTLWDPVPPSILMQSARASTQLHLQTILCILNYLYSSMQCDMHRRTEKSKVSTGVLSGLLNGAVRVGECTRPWELFVTDSSYYYTVELGDWGKQGNVH
jgi:hypothetical protein